ncbi:hypothetical protein AB0919_43540 [Streptomyces sp. NPDC046994]|uniref:hypothetical protein n=1 Tax=Streptomyces sp. NPDC046994 TaxID=3155735 RepID=UPI0034562140
MVVVIAVLVVLVMLDLGGVGGGVCARVSPPPVTVAVLVTVPGALQENSTLRVMDG